MGYFINQPSFLRCFYSKEAFSILSVGYDNFSFVKPLSAFRTQSFYTWHFVVSGSGTLEIYDKRFNIKSGEMFFIPPNIKMRYYPDENSPWEYVWFSFKGDLSDQYGSLAGFSPDNPVCKGGNFEKIKQVLNKTLASLTADECGYFGVLSAFFEILETLTSEHKLTGIKQVKRMLDENFTTPAFSIGQLCHDVGISHAHLLRLFKSAYGVTLIKYITQKRIDLACKLLCTTDLSVSSISLSCGFSDEIHFMKAFKKVTGMSALQYRRSHL